MSQCSMIDYYSIPLKHRALSFCCFLANQNPLCRPFHGYNSDLICDLGERLLVEMCDKRNIEFKDVFKVHMMA